MRKYQSIWLKIKTEGTCIIAAHPSLHKRVKKAVTKEKWKDTCYKVQWDLAGTEQPFLEITHPIDKTTGKQIKNQLLFTLIKPVLLTEL